MSLQGWSRVSVLSLGVLTLACGGDDGKTTNPGTSKLADGGTANSSAGGGDSDGGSAEGGGNLGPNTGAVCDPSVSYAADIQPFMTKYCIKCHATDVPVSQRYGAPIDHNFETEMGIAKEHVHADEDSGSGPNATNTAMPPVKLYPNLNLPVPTVQERQTLSKWLACQTASDDG